MEDADDFVCGRVRRALLVSVIESVELRGDDPRSERTHEDRRLGTEPDSADQTVVGEEKLSREECSEEAQDVRREQHSPDEPAPSKASWRGLCVLLAQPSGRRGEGLGGVL